VYLPVLRSLLRSAHVTAGFGIEPTNCYLNLWSMKFARMVQKISSYVTLNIILPG